MSKSGLLPLASGDTAKTRVTRLHHRFMLHATQSAETLTERFSSSQERPSASTTHPPRDLGHEAMKDGVVERIHVLGLARPHPEVLQVAPCRIASCHVHCAFALLGEALSFHLLSFRPFVLSKSANQRAQGTL